MSNTKTAKSRTKTVPTKVPIANLEQPQASPDTAEETASSLASIAVEDETTAQIMQMEQPNDIALAGESDGEQSPVAEAVSDENPADEEQKPVVDESYDASESDDDTNIVLQVPQHVEVDATQDVVLVENLIATEAQPRRTERCQKQSLSPRYEIARREVSRLRSDLFVALNEKAALLGNGAKRVGESVPLKYTHPEIAAIDRDIQRVTSELESLRARKKDAVAKMVPDVGSLDRINSKIKAIQLARAEARIEKQRAYLEATTASTEL